MRSRLAIRQIDRDGDTVTLRVYTSGVADDYGDKERTYTDTTATAIRSVQTNTKQPFLRDTEAGMYNFIEVEFFFKDTVTIPDPAIVGEDFNEIIWRGETYSITELEDSKIGVQRAMCRRKRI